MKKFLRALLIILSSAVLVYGIYIGVDCVRLSKVGTSEKPFITVNEVRDEAYLKYYGLGYTVTYRIDTEKATLSEAEKAQSNYPGAYVYGAECKLFDKALLWAWVE